MCKIALHQGNECFLRFFCSCLILPVWYYTLKICILVFMIQYSLVSAGRENSTSYSRSLIGELKDFSISFPSSANTPSFSAPQPPPVALIPLSSFPATPGNYKLVHNNNSQMYPSISLSSLSAVSGVAERLAGVKGQLINGAQFDKSQWLLSSSRVFRAERRTTEINA